LSNTQVFPLSISTGPRLDNDCDPHDSEFICFKQASSPERHGNKEEKELFQVTVRHLAKGHVTFPVSHHGILNEFNEILAKHDHYGEYGNALCTLGDILWPPDRPLPYPAWGAIKTRLHVASLERFHELILALTTCVEDQLKTHCYNTVGNFLTFFESYKNRKDLTQSLESFYHEYNPPITPKHHTCVGLGLDLAGRIVELEQTYPGISSALFLASCEEDIGNVNRYVSTPTPDTRTSEKEHVVIALNISLEGRVGVLILDTGYHVPRPVIIMEDRLYPHTGWFKPGGTSRSRRLYNYTLHPSGRYVLWDVKEIRKGIEECESALIYTHQAFLSPVDCTERRNLVYNFKSLLKRDARGNVIAGLYFGLKPFELGHFALFYQDEKQQQVDFKISFKDIFLARELPETIYESLRRCQHQLELDDCDGLIKLLKETSSALNNTEFMNQLLAINQRIVKLAENN
ncbi:uncharacterized protein LOC116918502, partial [Daphnia magna]|uniref:uncharacterized protein LOC116918502 n=1 Tax=Daphnia magna TaxID=35525 RepID=UPI001E1BBCB4